MIDLNAPFPALRGAHELHERTTPDGHPVIVVVCGLELPDGTHAETAWDKEENFNQHVTCLLCDELELMMRGDERWSHGCQDSGDLGKPEEAM